ncbi:CocE/NonD family hydrolase [Geodermatophilus sp. TF02-6]|uniref:CocE/NonD family hydrolase n=1 Tax=Geodermatophilus sp. TF02-6 TaxID=2250575 RepID=UPI0011BF11CF|nr:CocE/NonD family hydrolase [Geodermatophilus sp. TF02-6]
MFHPRVTITDPPEDVTVDWEVAVPMRDGISLRANVFRPQDDERHPVILSAHPYGKDGLPVHHETRHGYRVPWQYHLMRSAPLTHSAWTGWEAPDPAHWVPRGYVIVNADLRGWGTSEGEPSMLSEQEGLDIHDLVEWAAEQPWSTGRVGMSGVSYLAVSQWAGAAARPPHLAAICPWEGWTDFYRDFARPGGTLNTGFFAVYGKVNERRSHGAVALYDEARQRTLVDDWYRARDRDLEAIDVPALVCGSFSDHDLHTRGSFEGFRRIASADKWLYTHRGPKWGVYYSAEGLEAQARFFDHFLGGEDTGITAQPPVRLEIREDRTTITEVRHLTSWPPAETDWQTLRCRAGHDAQHGALEQAASGTPEAPPDETVTFPGRHGRASFTHRFATDTNVVGPMVATLSLSLEGDDDLSVFVGVRKFRDGKEVTFEGSYGFQGDMVTHGMLLVSHRAQDPERSLPHRPYHSHTERQPVAPGETVHLQVELFPSATLFRAGDELRLDVQARWFFDHEPVHGQFPASHAAVDRATCTLHLGAGGGCSLLLPILDGATTSRW